MSQTEIKKFLEGAVITSIEKEGDFIWCTTWGHGIFRYSLLEDKWINFSTKSKNLENDFFYNVAVSKDYIWAGASEGLFIYNKKKDTWTNKKFAVGGEMGNWVRALKYDPQQNILWIGRFKNLTLLNVKRQVYEDIDRTLNKDPKTNNFISIKLEGDSIIWFGTEAGVHKYTKKKSPGDKTAWYFYDNKKNGFNLEGDAVSVSDILFEKNYIWFGTDEFITKERPQFNPGGIYRYNRRNQWTRISKQNGLPANGIYALEKTGNFIWAAVYQFDRSDKKEYGKGIVLLDRNTGKLTQVNLNETSINTSNISNLLFDGKNMWLGTDNGIYRVGIENPLAKWNLKKEIKKKEPQKKNTPKK